MRFIFHHKRNFENWDWRNSVETGIGGSETCMVEMSWRLARAGHEVICYAPLPDDCPGTWRNTTWLPLSEADFSIPGVWVNYRAPELLDEFPEHHPSQQLWLMSQDWDYTTAWNPERFAKVDRFMAVTRQHGEWISNKYPELAPKMLITANCVKVDLIEEIEHEFPDIRRDPKKIIYASSPDRGLEYLLKIFKRAHEREPSLSLHIFYGFDNIDKIPNDNWRKYKEYILHLADQPGVFVRGRISQNQLYREWLSAGMLCYPSTFWETGFITGQEAQCCGAIPVINPVWGQGEVVHHGVFIEGDPYHDPLIQARFAYELVRLAREPELQEEIRMEMVPEARARCDWQTQVPVWVTEAQRGLQ